jgi:hypothetical protein
MMALRSTSSLQAIFCSFNKTGEDDVWAAAGFKDTELGV